MEFNTPIYGSIKEKLVDHAKTSTSSRSNLGHSDKNAAPGSSSRLDLELERNEAPCPRLDLEL